MKVKTALILCAGYGKRLAPITNDIPKPLLKVKNINLLDNTLKFVQSVGINKIIINTFYLSEQIKNFIEKKNYSLNIDVVSDGEKILDTGGGIYNLIKHSKEEDFLILNPDTLWNSNYINIFNEMEKYYFKNKIKNLLMVVKKNRSFDIRFKGDFNLKGNKLFKEINNEFIYTGCQILNRNIFQKINKSIFSMSEIWNNLLDKKELFGYESLNEFEHLTDIEIFKKLN
jgi:MurNAc alpha-1-phosphate uridylyltransferase|tara:strand:+ start:175 stop:858 length:684 start_codon:yes stop_codon:yes gene_type:complete